MSTIHFDSSCAPAHTVPCRELFATFLQENAPSDKADLNGMKKAFDCLEQFLPDANTENFGAKELRRFQNFLAERYQINYLNKLVNFIRSVFNWGVIEGFVTPQAAYALKIVPPIKPGKAKEAKQRTDAPLEHINAAQRHLSEMPADIIISEVETVTYEPLCRVCFETMPRPIKEECAIGGGEFATYLAENADFLKKALQIKSGYF